MIALAAIVSFSFEMVSSFVITDDVQFEIVDTDLEDDLEFDDEFDAVWNLAVMEVLEVSECTDQSDYHSPQTLKNQYLKELSTPPPDCV